MVTAVFPIPQVQLQRVASSRAGIPGVNVISKRGEVASICRYYTRSLVVDARRRIKTALRQSRNQCVVQDSTRPCSYQKVPTEMYSFKGKHYVRWSKGIFSLFSCFAILGQPELN